MFINAKGQFLNRLVALVGAIVFSAACVGAAVGPARVQFAQSTSPSVAALA